MESGRKANPSTLPRITFCLRWKRKPKGPPRPVFFRRAVPRLGGSPDRID